MHAEVGFFSCSEERLRATLRRMLASPPAVVAVVDGPDRLEAGIGLDFIQHWYSEDWFWADKFITVHPLHRRQRHHDKLLDFAVWWYETVAKPAGSVVIISIETMRRLGAKERLFASRARRVGGSYLIGDPPRRAPTQ
jgi:GNAT superfamily N-acetyltransferase